MKKQLLFALMLLMVGIQAQSKELHESSFLRLGLAYAGESWLLEEGGNEVEYTSSNLGAMMTFQIEQGPFIQMGLTKHWLHEVRYNNTVSNQNESESAVTIGGGFRLPLVIIDGFYIGLGYQYTKTKESDVNPVHSTRLFFEEEQKNNYGRLSITQVERIDDFKSVDISGTYVWFLQNGLGLGLNVAVGRGETDGGYDSEADITTGRLGLVAMFRLGEQGE